MNEFVKTNNEILNKWVLLSKRISAKCKRAFAGNSGTFSGYFPSGDKENYPLLYVRDNFLQAEGRYFLDGFDSIMPFAIELMERQLPSPSEFEFYCGDVKRSDGMIPEALTPDRKDDLYPHIRLSNTVDSEPYLIHMVWTWIMYEDNPELLHKKVNGEKVIDHLHRALGNFTFNVRFDKNYNLIFGGHGCSWSDAPHMLDDSEPTIASSFVLFNNVHACRAAYELSKLYDMAGNHRKSREWKNHTMRLKDAINNMFWREDEGYYRMRLNRNMRESVRPGIRKSDKGIDYEGNAAAIYYSIADAPRARRILSKIEMDLRKNNWDFLPMFYPLYPDGWNKGYDLKRGKHPDIWLNKKGMFQNGGIWARTQYACALAAFSSGEYALGLEFMANMMKKEIERDDFWEWWSADEKNIGVRKYGWNSYGMVALIKGMFGIDFDINTNKIVIAPAMSIITGGEKVILKTVGGKYLSLGLGKEIDKVTYNYCSNYNEKEVVLMLDNRSLNWKETKGIIDGSKVKCYLQNGKVTIKGMVGRHCVEFFKCG